MNTAVSLSRLPTAADVEDAARLLAGVAVRTPLLSNAVLDQITGGRVFLKAEIFQRTGSFKFRGAYNRIARIPESARAGGVVAFSSGNHAQGVAAAAKLRGLPRLDRDAERRTGGENRADEIARRRDRALRPRARGPRGNRPQARTRAQCDARAALRRPSRHRGPGNGRPRDLRGPGGAGARARHRHDAGLRRRFGRRHFAGGEGAPSGRAHLDRRARGLRRSRALVSARASVCAARITQARSAMRF